MCDTVVKVEPGRVLFAKNSDRDPNESQLIEWHPARTHRDGATVQCTYLEIPQASRTYATMISRPFWMWGAEMGTNEHGLTIGNEAVFTREPYDDTGLTGMDLLRLTLERARDRHMAVTVLTDLLATHGQGGGCGHEDRSFTYHNSFLIADPSGAVVIETAGGHWTTEEVAEGSRGISNGLTIEPFASRYADRLRSRVSACRSRRACTEAGAGDADGAADLARVLRSHGDGSAPRYSAVNGAMAAPCMHAGGLLAASQTTASWVSELAPTGSRHWATATAAPCTSLFKPVVLDTPVDLGPEPTGRFDPASLWWRHERFHRAALRDPARCLSTFAAERDEVERGWFTAPPASAVAFATADELTARWQASLPDDLTDTRPRHVRRYWRHRDERAGVAAHHVSG